MEPHRKYSLRASQHTRRTTKNPKPAPPAAPLAPPPSGGGRRRAAGPTAQGCSGQNRGRRQMLARRPPVQRGRFVPALEHHSAATQRCCHCRPAAGRAPRPRLPPPQARRHSTAAALLLLGGRLLEVRCARQRAKQADRAQLTIRASATMGQAGVQCEPALLLKAGTRQSGGESSRGRSGSSRWWQGSSGREGKPSGEGRSVHKPLGSTSVGRGRAGQVSPRFTCRSPSCTLHARNAGRPGQPAQAESVGGGHGGRGRWWARRNPTQRQRSGCAAQCRWHRARQRAQSKGGACSLAHQ